MARVKPGGEPPRALLVYPPVHDFALYDLFLKPYGLLRIGLWLRDGGWDVRVVNALDYEDPESAAALGRPKRRADGTGKMFRSLLPYPGGLENCGRRFSRYGIIPDSFRRRIADSADGCGVAPDIILVSTGMTYWYPGAQEAVRICREVHPGVPVAAGGIYATLMPEHCAASTGADRVVAGDRSGDLAAVLGEFGLPAPRGDYPREPLFARELWREAGVLRLNTGCPLLCDYCASRRLSPVFEAGDPDAAFRTLISYMECGVRNFAFYDDALLVNKEKVFLPFLERVADRYGYAGQAGDGGPAAEAPRFHLPNAVHIGLLDPDTARLMRRAGFREIRMGFESASPGFHAEHTPKEAKFSPGAFPRAAEFLVEAGFPPESLSVYILAGLPGQSAREVAESVRFVRKARVRVHLSEYSPVPGSGLWEESVRRCRYPIGEEPLYHNNSFFPMEWEGFTRRDLQELKNLVRGD